MFCIIFLLIIYKKKNMKKENNSKIEEYKTNKRKWVGKDPSFKKKRTFKNEQQK